MQNANRSKIYRAIIQYPGSSFTDLRMLLGIKNGTLSHHLIKLEKEGLFDPERKRPIPRFPETVGIVTSPTGAALRDILNVLGRRFGGVRVLLSPVRVQGEGAAEEIVQDIQDLNRDGGTDYIVSIAPPTCLRATQAFGADPSSLSLPASMSVAPTWNTVWDVDASVDGADNAGGATVRIRQGVRVLLSQADRDMRCP